MSTQEILIERVGPVATVTLNRPDKRNAMTFEMYAGVAEFCRSAAQDDDLKVIIVRGAGEKAFAAGTDISLFRDFKGAEDGLAYEAKMDGVLSDIESCPKPMVAAITGACTGGGAAIAALCDIRLATKDMRFGFPIARTLGNCLSVASLQRMSALMGAARTKDLIMTSRLIEAEEALNIGLVSELFDDADALFARMMAAEPTIKDDDLIAMCYGSADFHEGLEAFLAKRKANWTGK
jgi:enoyl-CoA hydratase